MSETARDRILARLRSAMPQEIPRPEVPAPAAGGPNGGARVDRLKSLMEAMRTEVYRVPVAAWIPHVKKLLQERHIRTLLYAPSTPIGTALAEAWHPADGGTVGPPELVPYSEPVESLKEMLFGVDAAITAAAGAVADTGALILRPTALEPRLMSLVPPVHIAVLEADTIFSSLADAMRSGQWAQDMPTNLLLISGPSKTADIELTLAFGVHGPKELIVYILE
jgi:L-lactate dehydrogenase complex protein LldG